MANTKQTKTEREEFGAMSVDDLRARLDEEKKRLWTDRFALGKRTLNNTAELAKTRKRIARIQTYLRQHELSANQ